MALTLGMCHFTVAEEPATKTDPFLASTGAAQTWEELKTRSAEKRWESISRENKRENKKQTRKSRKELRKSNKNSEGIEFVPEFRKIPDDVPAASISTETEKSLPESKPFKTIGLEEKQPATNASTSDLKFNSQEPVDSVSQPEQIVPIFPSINEGGSKFVTTQKSYEDPAASPASGDGILSEEDLEDEVPHLLKKIAGINPFFNYEPDPEIAKNEPCRNLCPRPDGKPCKIVEKNGETILQCPREFQLSHEPYAGRNFSESIYTWEASNLNYNPLYFEDPNLERYGNSRKDLVQPFVSMGRFTGQLLALPYQMSIDPLRKRIYPLGYYRPGEYTPKRTSGIPWNTKAAVTQGLAVTGLVFLLP
ncbi:MAG: hypothetical protein K0U86_08975 [Planctomycetes bacterium]|nr:hypothetical protein [Planctomycetota bacterium]MCH9725021.1 hypothetical protein [Planctomycetota bacterium]MCH9779307.1 hypothetical protein [Planctomycetota bacterium]MCH9793312.1 hypothetical protein [Planctomycetota bacterium]MDF1746404.1 hypothetical protein [Gimesia sp.]